MALSLAREGGHGEPRADTEQEPRHRDRTPRRPGDRAGTRFRLRSESVASRSSHTGTGLHGRAVRPCRSRPLGSVRMERVAVLDSRQLRRGCARGVPRSRAGTRCLRRSFGQRDDGGSGRGTGPRRVQRPGPPRAVAALHRRPGHRIPGRIQRRGHRRASRGTGSELSGLVGCDGPGHHGEPGAPGTRRRTDRSASAAPTPISPASSHA